MKAAALVVLAATATAAMGLGIASPNDARATENKTQVAQDLACLITTTYKLPDGSTGTDQTCLPDGFTNCNSTPPLGFCAPPWGKGIMNENCRAVPHCGS